MTSRDIGTMVGAGFGKFVREVGIPFACLIVMVYFVMSDRSEDRETARLEREAVRISQEQQAKVFEAQADAMRDVGNNLERIGVELESIKRNEVEHTLTLKQHRDSIDRLTDSVERRRPLSRATEDAETN